MNREQLTMLKELMALEFTVIDLHLYLDTHPDDEKALSDYNILSRQLENLEQRYVQLYGPVMARQGAGRAWVEEPWPWQINYEEEGGQNVGI